MFVCAFIALYIYIFFSLFVCFSNVSSISIIFKPSRRRRFFFVFLFLLHFMAIVTPPCLACLFFSTSHSLV